MEKPEVLFENRSYVVCEKPIAPTYEELTQMDDLLSTNKTLIWYYAKDEEDAKRALKIVEKYR